MAELGFERYITRTDGNGLLPHMLSGRENLDSEALLGFPRGTTSLSMVHVLLGIDIVLQEDLKSCLSSSAPDIRHTNSVNPIQVITSVFFHCLITSPNAIKRQAPTTKPTFGGKVSRSSVVRDVSGPR